MAEDINYCIYCRKKLKSTPKYKFCSHCKNRKFKLSNPDQCNTDYVNKTYVTDMEYCYKCGVEEAMFRDDEEQCIMCLECDLRIDFASETDKHAETDELPEAVKTEANKDKNKDLDPEIRKKPPPEDEKSNSSVAAEKTSSVVKSNDKNEKVHSDTSASIPSEGEMKVKQTELKKESEHVAPSTSQQDQETNVGTNGKTMTTEDVSDKHPLIKDSKRKGFFIAQLTVFCYNPLWTCLA